MILSPFPVQQFFANICAVKTSAYTNDEAELKLNKQCKWEQVEKERETEKKSERESNKRGRTKCLLTFIAV